MNVIRTPASHRCTDLATFGFVASINAQLIAKRYKLKLPYSVVLLMVGGLLGYAEYKYNAPDAKFDPASDMYYA